MGIQYIKPDGQSLIQEGDESRSLDPNSIDDKEFSPITDEAWFEKTIHSFEYSDMGGMPTKEQHYEIRRPVPVEEKYYKPADDDVVQIGDEYKIEYDPDDPWIVISNEYFGETIHHFEHTRHVGGEVLPDRIFEVRRPTDNAPKPVNITFDGKDEHHLYSLACGHAICPMNDGWADTEELQKKYKYPGCNPFNQKQEDVLEEALRITSGDRQNQYGPPDQDFRRTATMANALWADRFKDGMGLEPHDIAQFMVLMKLSRLQHQRKRDSVVDIAGYARCLDMCYVANGGYPVVQEKK